MERRLRSSCPALRAPESIVIDLNHAAGSHAAVQMIEVDTVVPAPVDVQHCDRPDLGTRGPAATGLLFSGRGIKARNPGFGGIRIRP